MKSNEEKLADILSRLDQLSYVKTEKIPNIDLYMDQVTTFMETYLKKTKRYPDDKVLTKTMINNYAKNDLLPPPVKKKYSREHILILLFIYYYKNLISINDIKQLLDPITEQHFNTDAEPPLCDIYERVFSLEQEQMDRLKDDIQVKFDTAQTLFTDAPEDSRDYLQLFAFISELSFDVYLKKQMIEMMIDQLRAENTTTADKKKKK
ncbi:MAG: DUF1836 domain-containing protein [Lachnospiraceae bacterium]